MGLTWFLHTELIAWDTDNCESFSAIFVNKRIQAVVLVSLASVSCHIDYKHYVLLMITQRHGPVLQDVFHREVVDLFSTFSSHSVASSGRYKVPLIPAIAVSKNVAANTLIFGFSKAISCRTSLNCLTIYK